MTNPIKIEKVCIQDGKGGKVLVRLGNSVELLPVHLHEDEEFFAQKHFDFLRGWLGEGPFTIDWIGQWPCGRVMLYIKGGKANGAGAHASDFKIFEISDVIKEIAELVKEECHKDTNPYGACNSWRHINHVVEVSKELAEKNDAKKDVVEIAAWLHDWAAIHGFYEDHHIRGSEEAKKILLSLNLPITLIVEVQHCILTHRSSQDITRGTVEAHCVANADAVAHYLEIPDLLCSKYAEEKTMTVSEVIDWLKKKLQRDLKKLTIPEAKEMVEPYRQAAETLFERR